MKRLHLRGVNGHEQDYFNQYVTNNYKIIVRQQTMCDLLRSALAGAYAVRWWSGRADFHTSIVISITGRRMTGAQICSDSAVPRARTRILRTRRSRLPESTGQARGGALTVISLAHEMRTIPLLIACNVWTSKVILYC